MKNLIFLLVSSLYAGQSLTNSSVTGTIPFRDNTVVTRVEMVYDTISNTSNVTLLNSGALGLNVSLASNTLQIHSLRSSTNCTIGVSGKTKLYIRVTINPAKNALFCQVWDQTGNWILNRSKFLISLAAGSGTDLTINTLANQNLAFLRVHSTSLSKVEFVVPPSAVNTSNVVHHWKFDNSLAAFVGGVTLSGTANYATTANAVLANVGLNPSGLDSITNGTVGKTETLIGAASTLSDTSATVTCSWALGSSPVRPYISSQTACSPNVQFKVFGEHTFTLTAVDDTAASGTKTGVIPVSNSQNNLITTDGNFQPLFGPLSNLAVANRPFIQNRLKYGAAAQRDWAVGHGFPKIEDGVPDWVTNNASGTISYTYGGLSTTLASSIIDTSSSITVSNAAALSNSEFPTLLRISGGGITEDIRVCSLSTNTYTVCPGYRGVASPLNSLLDSWTAPASSFSAGASVKQLKIAGTSTLFSTDSVKPLCPAGLPGPTGSVRYSTGTATIADGSTTITGSGTAWSSNASANNVIRVSSLISGAAGPFWARITAVNSDTSITIDRPVPVEFDAGTYSYSIVSLFNVALEYTMANTVGLTLTGRTAKALHVGIGCQSETQAFADAAYDLTLRGVNLGSTALSGLKYSTYTGGTAVQNQYGPNFYGVGLAGISYYLQTGDSTGLKLSKQIDDYWVRHPNAVNGILLLRFGALAGAIACLVTRSDCQLDWRDVRAAVYTTAPANCNSGDSRDIGAAIYLIALMAYYDPSSSDRTTWSNILSGFKTLETTCVATAGYPTGFYWNPYGSSLTMTNNSTNATGTGIPSSFCTATTTGSATATLGSSILTSSSAFTNADTRILVSNGVNQQLYSYSFVNSSQIQLSGTWPYATGNVTFMQANSSNVTAFGNSSSSPELASNFVCKWNSSSSITLSKPWPYSSGTYLQYTSNVAGTASQPFMIAIRLWGYYVASLTDSAWATLLNNSSQISWLNSNSYDSELYTVHYARFCELCENLDLTQKAGTFDYLFPDNSFGYSQAGGVVGRTQIGELLQGFGAGQKITSTSSMFSITALNKAAFCNFWDTDDTCDKYSIGLNPEDGSIGDASLDSYKWFGFWFGSGKSQSSEAYMLSNNPSPPAAITTKISVSGNKNLSYFTSSGAVGSVSCNSSCQVTTQMNPIMGVK